MMTATTVLSMLSRVLGWSYTLAWSLSFYPQLLKNLRKGSTVGLSTDFVVLNVLGHSSYLLYNTMLFSSKIVRKEYKSRHHGQQNVVQLNDVVFSAHATLLALLTFCQFVWYTMRARQTPNVARSGEQSRQHISRTTELILSALLTITVATLGAKGVGIIVWLDVANVLAAFKLFITIVKYIPQIRLNTQRKSTTGFSIENILLDLAGGTLSLLQLGLDAAIEERHHRHRHRASRWLASVLGDSGKLGLSVLTLGFDSVLIFQHYVLYRNQQPAIEDDEEYTPAERPDHGTFASTGSAPSQHAQPTESTSLLQHSRR